jgi:hypothetical protein
MGTWGFGVLDDDFARDVYDEYVEACAGGKSGKAIVQALRKKFGTTVSDPDEGPVFWLAVAQAQWACASVTPDVHRRVEKIVGKGLGLARWEEAGRAELARRRKALARFVEKIQTPRRGKPRLPAKTAPVPFAVGDCLAIDVGSGEFAAAVITRHLPGRSASHILSIVDFLKTEPPAPQVFAPPSWVTITTAPELTILKYQAYADGYRRHQAKYRVVDRLELGEVPPPLTMRLCNWGNMWKDLGERLRRHAPGIL